MTPPIVVGRHLEDVLPSEQMRRIWAVNQSVLLFNNRIRIDDENQPSMEDRCLALAERLENYIVNGGANVAKAATS